MTDERAFVRGLAEFFGRDPRRVRVGIGDDGAVVANHGKHTVVVCDPVIEGVHFESNAPLRLVGRKAVNRNLSDLAAMGAVPDHLLVSVLLPVGLDPRRRRNLFTGIREAAVASRSQVVGGDVAVTPGPLTVTVTALGHLAGRELLRTAARVGDRIYVTGPLGGAALGHHLRFRPSLAEGKWLARQRGVGAVIDVSDGLLLDLDRVLEASGGLGAVIDAPRVPIAPAARRLAARGDGSPLDHALRDGEDHVLLFTWRGNLALPRSGPLVPAARVAIGEVTEQRGLRLREADGGERAVRAEGFVHRL